MTNLRTTAPGCVHGQTYPHPNDCQHFYICYRGWFALETCDFGSVYSRAVRHCVSLDSPDNDCKRKNKNVQRIKKTTKAASTTTEGNDIEMQQLEIRTTREKPPTPKIGNDIEMQQIEIRTTRKNPPPKIGKNKKTQRIKKTTKAAPATTTKGNDIKMQQIEITTMTGTPSTTHIVMDTRPTPVNSLCVHGETYFYPYQCQLYYLCYNGFLLTEHCTSDLVYSRSAKQCVSPTSPDNDCVRNDIEMQQIEMRTTRKNPPPKIGKNKRTQRIKKTTKAASATTTEGNDIEMQQIEITGTTETTPTPIQDWQFTTKSTTTTEIMDTQQMPVNSLCVHGQTYFYPYQCQLYYLCYNNLFLIESCASDLVYSRSAKQCVSPTSPDNDCVSNGIEFQQIEITTTDTVPDNTDGKNTKMQRIKSTKAASTTTTKEAVRSLDQNCTDRVVYPDQIECRKYYYCIDGKLERRTCFLDYVFSRRLKHCVPRYSHFADCESIIRLD